MPVVGVPKTIDNDLGATDYTFGFDTAVNIAMEAIDRLHTTADSHHRVLIVEVMGRHAGWIAFHAGLAGGANVILIPELPFDLDRVCEFVGRRFEHHYAPILVVAEGAQPVGGMPETKSEKLDQFGHVAPRGDRPLARGGDRAADGQGGAGDGAGARAAGRDADGVRPGAGDPVRVARDRCGRCGGLGQDDRAARHRYPAGRAE